MSELVSFADLLSTARAVAKEGSRYVAFASRVYKCRCSSVTIGPRTLVWVTALKDKVSYVPLTDSEARDLAPSEFPRDTSEQLTTYLAWCPECKGNQFRMGVEAALRSSGNDRELRDAVRALLNASPPDFPHLETLNSELEKFVQPQVQQSEEE